MPKRRLQVWLSEAALEELARRAGAPDKRQQYLESLFTGGLKAYERPERIDDDPEAEQQAKEKRAEKKEAQTQRKAARNKAVKDALPATRKVGVAFLGEEVTLEVRPHTFHSGTNPIPGCSECASIAKENK